MKQCPTFTASIYVGRRKHYGEYITTTNIGRRLCQDFCDAVGLCVTFTETEFIYKNGNEPGLIVGLINYPRFPDAELNIKVKALELARALLIAYEQLKVSVVFPDETIMLEPGD